MTCCHPICCDRVTIKNDHFETLNELVVSITMQCFALTAK
jgi:hypothetical protein